MLIRFSDIVSKYSAPKGIIHIGAHMMEERIDYHAFGYKNTIWCEANPSLFALLNAQLENSEEQVFSYAICDVSDELVKLNLANNGQSSSILDLEKHKIYHPNVVMTDVTEVRTKRMDDLIKENNIDISKYDFINLDIQGAELLALKGFGTMLSAFNFIYTEINKDYLYKNCALIDEIDDYVLNFGFKRVETVWTPFQWGDALYIKVSSL